MKGTQAASSGCYTLEQTTPICPSSMASSCFAAALARLLDSQGPLTATASHWQLLLQAWPPARPQLPELGQTFAGSSAGSAEVLGSVAPKSPLCPVMEFPVAALDSSPACSALASFWWISSWWSFSWLLLLLPSLHGCC